MKRQTSLHFGLRVLPALVFAAALAACGGSDDSSPEPTPPAPAPVSEPPAAPRIVSGTAAVGAALAGANVTVTDGALVGVCAETTVVTDGTGNFTCTLLYGSTAPFIVVATDPRGVYPPMVSVVAAQPAHGGLPLVANVTPLTTAIVAQLSPTGNALDVAANPAALLVLADLAAITTNVLTQISAVLTVLGAPPNYDPFSTQIIAATPLQTGNTADQVIDMLRFSEVGGVTFVSTFDNPAGAVPVANAMAISPPLLPAPSAAAVALSDSMRFFTDMLTRCFSLPVEDRALEVNRFIPPSLGGPAVTMVAERCQGITHTNYLHNGYLNGQRFYGLLLDARMVRPTFFLPEVMLFIDDTTDADNDQAVLNIRYLDADGNAANIIEVARKLPGSSTIARPSEWWLYGNQQPVDTAIRSFVRRHQQFAELGRPQFANALPSRSEAGIVLFVNKDGPRSTDMRAARIAGPGLPPAGVVLTRPNSLIGTDQSSLNIRRKDGLTDPFSASPANDTANIFRLQRTQGLQNTSATRIEPNPNAGTSDNTSLPHWAHPLDYGATVSATDYIDFAQLRANSVYRVEIFYDGETLPRYTFDKRMLTPVVPATRAVNLQWVDLGYPASLYLDPNSPVHAADQTSITLNWGRNSNAEPISSAGVYTSQGNVSVNATAVPVAPGGTSAVAVPPGVPFRELTNDGTTSRLFQLRYRMLDGSYKDSTFRFN